MKRLPLRKPEPPPPPPTGPAQRLRIALKPKAEPFKLWIEVVCKMRHQKSFSLKTWFMFAVAFRIGASPHEACKLVSMRPSNEILCDLLDGKIQLRELITRTTEDED
jgi:hypothetical protein